VAVATSSGVKATWALHII